MQKLLVRQRLDVKREPGRLQGSRCALTLVPKVNRYFASFRGSRFCANVGSKHN